MPQKNNNGEYHRPVMLAECLEGLNIRPDGVYVDVTFGGGGHSRAILERLGPEGRLYAFDRDDDAVKNSIDDPRFCLIHENFKHLKNFLRLYGVRHIDGLLADLGVSSHQIDEAERGFSTRMEGPLDLRMDRREGMTAADLVNNADEEELEKILRLYGELPNAKQLARSIVKRRTESGERRTESGECDTPHPSGTPLREGRRSAAAESGECDTPHPSDTPLQEGRRSAAAESVEFDTPPSGTPLQEGRRSAATENGEPHKGIMTTCDLKEAVEMHLPRGRENKTLAMIFQALRIEVNGELEALQMMLTQAVEILNPGGRLCVMSYHSLEDRIVKNFFKAGNFEGEIKKDFFGVPQVELKLVSRKPITASEEELMENNRARSAKLRVAEKIN